MRPLRWPGLRGAQGSDVFAAVQECRVCPCCGGNKP